MSYLTPRQVPQLKTVAYVDPTKTFTTVQISAGRLSAVGTAKRNPVDVHDVRTGFRIAAARALEDLAAQLRASVR